MQIKIRGQRTEPAEVEHAIVSLEGVTAACVMMRNHPATHEAMLVAYVAPAALETQSVRQHCSACLARHMVPSLVVPMEAFPRLLNGKIDTSSLPTPDWSAAGKRDGSAAPQQHLHKQLVAIWEQVLQQQGIGIHDDFFEIGGSSLLSGQLATAIRQDMHVDISSMLIFQQSTVAAMAQDPAFSKMQRLPSASGRQEQGGRVDVDVPSLPRASSWNIFRLQFAWIILVQGLHFFSLVCFLLFLGQFSVWWKGHPHHIAAIIVPAPFLLALVIMWLLASTAAIKWCLLGRAKPGR